MRECGTKRRPSFAGTFTAPHRPAIVIKPTGYQMYVSHEFISQKMIAKVSLLELPSDMKNVLNQATQN